MAMRLHMDSRQCCSCRSMSKPRHCWYCHYCISHAIYWYYECCVSTTLRQAYLLSATMAQPAPTSSTTLHQGILRRPSIRPPRSSRQALPSVLVLGHKQSTAGRACSNPQTNPWNLCATGRDIRRAAHDSPNSFLAACPIRSA
jgi:hypothetical protein